MSTLKSPCMWMCSISLSSLRLNTSPQVQVGIEVPAHADVFPIALVPSFAFNSSVGNQLELVNWSTPKEDKFKESSVCKRPMRTWIGLRILAVTPGSQLEGRRTLGCVVLVVSALFSVCRTLRLPSRENATHYHSHFT